MVASCAAYRNPADRFVLLIDIKKNITHSLGEGGMAFRHFQIVIVFNRNNNLLGGVMGINYSLTPNGQRIKQMRM